MQLFIFLCSHYLSVPTCQEVIICQIQDREGFQDLLRKLNSLSIKYTLEEVPLQVYEYAQKIEVISVPHHAELFHYHGNQPSSLPCASSTACGMMSHGAQEESEAFIKKTYTFPPLLEEEVTSCSADVAEDTVAGSLESASPGYAYRGCQGKQRLIETDRESFRLLRAFR